MKERTREAEKERGWERARDRKEDEESKIE